MHGFGGLKALIECRLDLLKNIQPRGRGRMGLDGIPLGSEEAQARVPRTVVSTIEPAPIGTFGDQEPGVLAQGCAQMRYARVHAQDQIQVHDQSRSLGKVQQGLTPVANVAVFVHPIKFL